MTDTITPQDMTANILAVFNAIDLADVSAGVEWYAEAYTFCADLAAETGYSVDQCAGVVAATSPLMSWESNMRLAARILREGGLTSGYMGVGLRKCDAILAGADVVSTLKGQKIVNFYRSIKSAGQEGVTIDRHAYDIAVGMRHSDDSRPSIGAKLYAEVAAAYVAAAEALTAEGCPIGPAEVQSVTWAAWRAEHGGTRVAA